jgi:glycosyltransferase involved in cell wall biosynthesis
MIRAGMSVDLICLKGESESLRETVNGVNVLRLPIPKTRGGKVAYLVQYSAFVVACFILLAFRSVRKSHAVVHAHNMPDFLVFSALIPRILGSKVMLDLHDPMPELIQSIYGVPSNHWLVNLLIRLERWSIGFADLVITPNTTFRDLFEARGCPAGKILIVMNSPQIELFDPRRFETKPPAFGKARSFQLMYHGLLVERHGLETAIRQFDASRRHSGTSVSHLRNKTPYMARMTGWSRRSV